MSNDGAAVSVILSFCVALSMSFIVLVQFAEYEDAKDRVMALCAEKQIYAECQKAWEGE